MTKDEIEKALETCILGYCTGCPYDGCDGDCRDELHKDVLALITEQEEEKKQVQIDVLNKLKTNLLKSDDFMDICSWHIDKIIKEVENASSKGTY